MRQQDFEEANGDLWRGLEGLIAGTDASAYDVRRLPADYRRVCHHLAVSKHRGYSPYLVDRLNGIVVACHNRLYAQNSRFRYQWLRFLLVDYPRVLHRNRRFIAVATLLFTVPLLGLGLLCYFDPDFIYAVMDASQVRSMEGMYDPAARVLGRSREADTDLLMFGHYIQNNIGIAFREFAGGLPFGVYTVFTLFYNGVVIGAVAGHLTQLGYHSTFYPFIIGHGSFELTAIVLSGAAGLKIGMALIDPGGLKRSAALREASREAVQIVLGAAAMLLVAAFIEAFWSSKATLPIAIKIGVGAWLWLMVLYYLLFAGRAHRQGKS